MAKTFHCSIVTPAAATFDGDVAYATFPSWDGQYGMLAGMAPLLTDAFFQSMAVVIMFGLGFATVLTLVVLPVIYSLFFKIPVEGRRV